MAVGLCYGYRHVVDHLLSGLVGGFGDSAGGGRGQRLDGGEEMTGSSRAARQRIQAFTRSSVLPQIWLRMSEWVSRRVCTWA